ncbi:MAG: hypothetical protein C0483_19700 [Pirellula sp.]|nr:hypothetical protein [Pirellula sp.]
MRFLVFTIVALLLCTSGAVAEEPITTEEAVKRVGEEVSVKMEVKKAAVRGAVGFLNSESDFRDPKNFTIFLGGKILTQMKDAGIADPVEHFEGKTVIVKGKVALRNERPQIAPADADDIKLSE